jgi:AbrB family looped-hinge helix DNA binding protein
MTTLKLHYDGWLALPAGLRHKLGLKSGDRLEAELVGGTVVLRPAATARHQAEPKTPASEPPVVAPAAPPVEAAALGTRKPGRPRKVRAAEEPEPAAAPVSGAGELWKLRRKAERPTAEADDDQMTAPDRRPARIGFDTGYEREERHPFRHVEVRRLGPGRGHRRTRQRAMG